MLWIGWPVRCGATVKGHRTTNEYPPRQELGQRQRYWMLQSDSKSWVRTHPRRREYPRFDVQCRARIRIGARQYAGYLHNISQGGAKLRTITPIHKIGDVILKLPDMPPLRCKLRWTDSYNAGVSFELALSRADLAAWTMTRSGFFDLSDVAEIENVESNPD